MINIINTTDTDFQTKFDEILNRGKMDIHSVSDIVANILKRVRQEGDKAVIQDVRDFDKWYPEDGSDLIVTHEEMESGFHRLTPELKKALRVAYTRIEKFHKLQMPKSWIETEENGSMLGQKVTPIERAGLYIPGGKAIYPSSLLMNAIPAHVAGVKEIVVVSPTPNGEISDILLGAGYIANVKAIYKVGGASAIGAMAYGTETIPKVDVITGPGNIFVATAKKQVFGDVQIDMIAGPSEIGVLADEVAVPSHIAIDMLSQAEHDEMASSILITPFQKLAKDVNKEIKKWLQELERREIAERSIRDRGAIIVTETMDEAIDLMNQIAPEHLEVVTNSPFELLPQIKNAGAIFLGKNTPEAVGDYMAGPNHTLPTGGSAKFFSPLSVENFLKKSSIISFSKKALKQFGNDIDVFARTEQLDAHALSVKVRL
ncbi:histidinol dehydrogenase [Thiovulum sp. ES]|nr:histidinol dehydrogenase [Thiovulum sp. ES]